MCNTTDSVQWRNSPSGERLCNKCGVRSQRLVANAKKLELHNTEVAKRPRLPIYRPLPRKRSRKQSAPKRADFE
jgi:hypothetical protein